MPQKSYLVQRFAKLQFGALHVVGYSVAGEESVVQIPELNVCFDIGRCPWFALTSDYVCITHGHMDHIAGIAYYLSQRAFQGMKPGNIIVPREFERGVDAMLRCWREIERQGTPYNLIPISAGQLYPVRKDFGIRAFATHHGGTSLGYSLVNIREKLKPEFYGKSAQELADLKRDGAEIQYRLEVPLVAYLGDTTFGPVFEHPDVQNAEVLITECTFFDPTHHTRAKAGKHLHVDQLVQALQGLRNKDIVITHVSRRLGVRRAKKMLLQRVGAERMQNIHFLMDFDGAADAGDVEAVGPEPAGE